ncbi:hypothetical protein ACOMHN_013279 [Nucella lapillus]
MQNIRSGANSTEKPEHEVPDSTERAKPEALDFSGIPEGDDRDDSEGAEPREEETGYTEDSPLVDKRNFETEVKTTAAVMQIVIKQKMIVGNYP